MKQALLLVLIISSFDLFSQEKAVDSLELRIENASSINEKIALLNEASSFMANADLKRSLSYSERAKKLSLESNNELGLAHSLLNSGKYYTRVGMYDIAMRNYLEALQIAEKKSDKSLRGLVYKIIGNNYYFKHDYKMALSFYRKAILINKQIHNNETTADLQNNVGLIFINSKLYDSALLYLNEAIQPYEKLNKGGKLANTFLNIGLVKDETHQYKEAIEYYKKALALDKSLGLSLQEGVALNNIASSLIHLGDYENAKLYVKGALEIGERENFKSLLVDVYANLAVTTEGKDLSKALESLLKIKDSLYSESNSKLVEELRTKYESQQKEAENANLLKYSSVIEKQLFFVRSLFVFLAIFALIVTVLAIFYYKSLLQNRKAKNELTVMNRQVLLQNEAITEQAEKLNVANKEIAAMNENLHAIVEEKTFKISEQNERLIDYAFHNSHRVRGPLSRILGLINLVTIGAIKDEEIGFILTQIDAASKELDDELKHINKSLNSVLVDDPIN